MISLDFYQKTNHLSDLKLGSELSDLDISALEMAACSRYIDTGLLSTVHQKKGVLLSSGRLDPCHKNPEHDRTILALDPLWNGSLQKANSLCENLSDHNPDLIKGSLCGSIGFLSYESKADFEETKLYSPRDELIPRQSFYLYKHNFVIQADGSTTYYRLNTKDLSLSPDPAHLDKRTLEKLKATCSKQNKVWFKAAVEKVKSYILKGDVYQANISRGVFGQSKRPSWEIAADMFNDNPASMQAYFASGPVIISTSPERLIRSSKSSDQNTDKSSDQYLLEALPIKGTLPRLSDKKEDLEAKNSLIASRKNKAELAMITDLLRNDLATCSIKGSVEVKAFQAIQSYANVHHTHSHIISQSTANREQILAALFPGGSISGCPKIRACQIIDEIEEISRGAYTGSLGYLDLSGGMDFNIMIRSVMFFGDTFYYRVGGGITLLSQAEDEYQETVFKEATLKKYLCK